MADEIPSSSRNLKFGAYLAVAGVVAIVVFAAFSAEKWVGVLGVALAMAIGAGVAGLFIGFLFAVPRTSVAGAAASPTGGAELGPPDHQVNTNLQEISDWLTKIIVGVTLVQLGEILGTLSRIGNAFDTAFAVKGAGIFAISVVVLYFGTGLLFGFLWTRLELQLLISVSDKSLLGRLRQRLRQEDEDAALLALARAAIDTAQPLPDAKAAAAAVKAASPEARRVAFYQSREKRRFWTTSGERAALDRLIPILDGLMAADKQEFGTDGKYHRNYAELACIYRDRGAPDYDRAIDLVSMAIRIRDSVAKAEAQFFAEYEFGRASARILTDAKFRQNETADPPAAAAIVADLNFAMTHPTLIELIRADQQIGAWLALNGFRIDNDRIVS